MSKFPRYPIDKAESHESYWPEELPEPGCLPPVVETVSAEDLAARVGNAGATYDPREPPAISDDESLDYWLDRVRTTREDNTATGIRTGRYVAPDDIYADPVFIAAFQDEANCAHRFGHRVHGFVFECVCAIALRRAGFDAALTRSGGRADIDIVFPGEDADSDARTLRIQLKSYNADSLTGKRKGTVDINDPDSVSEFDIGEYAQRRRAMTAYESTLREEKGWNEGKGWTWNRYFNTRAGWNHEAVAGAISAVLFDHLLGYENILHCESFTEDGQLFLGLNSIDSTAMGDVVDGFQGYIRPGVDGNEPSGRREAARKRREEGRLTVMPLPEDESKPVQKWLVRYHNDANPPEPLFDAYVNKACQLNIERLTPRNDLMISHDPIEVEHVNRMNIDSRATADVAPMSDFSPAAYSASVIPQELPDP